MLVAVIIVLVHILLQGENGTVSYASTSYW